MKTTWILQTYYFDANGKQRGFNREFDSQQAAKEYTENNPCGSTWEIYEMPILQFS